MYSIITETTLGIIWIWQHRMRLRVDTTKPTVSLSSEGAMIPSDEITITATDSRSGLKYIRYKWSKSPITNTWIDAGQIVNNGLL